MEGHVSIFGATPDERYANVDPGPGMYTQVLPALQRSH